MATHSSILAWRIPGTEEPSGLLSMGSHRVRHYRSDLAAIRLLHLTGFVLFFFLWFFAFLLLVVGGVSLVIFLN